MPVTHLGNQALGGDSLYVVEVLCYDEVCICRGLGSFLCCVSSTMMLEHILGNWGKIVPTYSLTTCRGLKRSEVREGAEWVPMEEESM